VQNGSSSSSSSSGTAGSSSGTAADSAPCPCPCRYGADAGCSCRDLEAPLRVSVTKTPTYATYPLTYLRPFNYGAREAVVSTGTGWPSLTCDAGALSSSPTCGWATTGSGLSVADRVPDSQGFCCDCSLDQLGSGTLGGGSTQGERARGGAGGDGREREGERERRKRETQKKKLEKPREKENSPGTRGNLNCNLFSSFFIAAGSAHCLRHDPLWYEGYEMGTSLVDFEITVNATTTTTTSPSSSPSSSSASQDLLLTPASPAGVLPAAGVAARLLGDLSSYYSPPDLGGSVLLIPHPPDATSLTQILTQNTSEWLVVDKSLVSLDGRDCDRVGTSYPAFRSQASACSSAQGACLHNQIRDLRASDAARVAQGLRPRHLVGRWGGGQPGAAQAFKRGGVGPLWFGLPLPSTSASLVTLSVDAGSLRVVTNVARGKVRSARVCAGASTAAAARAAKEAAKATAAKATSSSSRSSSPTSSSPSSSPSSPLAPPPAPPPTKNVTTAAAAATCGSFQALTQTGYLTATIANEGAVAADFTVTVTGCGSASPPSASSPSTAPLPVLPPPAVYLSLQPGEARDAVFELHATSDAAGGVPSASCSVSVLDALGAATDLLAVAFSVNATEYQPPPVDGGGDGDGGGRPGAPRRTCSQRCPSWTSLACRLRARCWRELLLSAAAAAALVAAAALLACGLAKGWWSRLFSCCFSGCCCCCCRGGSSGRRKRWPSGLQELYRQQARQQQQAVAPPPPPPSPPPPPDSPPALPFFPSAPATPLGAQGSGAGLLSSSA